MIIIIWNLDGTWSSIWGLVRPFRDFGLYWFGLYWKLAVNIDKRRRRPISCRRRGRRSRRGCRHHIYYSLYVVKISLTIPIKVLKKSIDKTVKFFRSVVWHNYLQLFSFGLWRKFIIRNYVHLVPETIPPVRESFASKKVVLDWFCDSRITTFATFIFRPITMGLDTLKVVRTTA